MDTVAQSLNKQGGNHEKVLRYYSSFDDHIDVPRLCNGTGDHGESERRIAESCYDGGQQSFRWGEFSRVTYRLEPEGRPLIRSWPKRIRHEQLRKVLQDEFGFRKENVLAAAEEQLRRAT